MDFDIRKAYTVDPSWAPSVECDAAYLCSGLIQRAYLTKMYNHYEKMRWWSTQTSNWKNKCIQILN